MTGQERKYPLKYPQYIVSHASAKYNAVLLDDAFRRMSILGAEGTHSKVIDDCLGVMNIEGNHTREEALVSILAERAQVGYGRAAISTALMWDRAHGSSVEETLRKILSHFKSGA